jgi:lipid-A-disaccharide synthase
VNRSLRIGIVAGEASGDILGAGLMAALRSENPQIRFEGVGGPRMLAQGFVSFYPLDRLSVMGLVDPLKRLPELLRMRRNLVDHFLSQPPDVYIGIDSPDFNLGIERQLHAVGIKTVHYVSPSVWAWRQGRVKKIARSVDLMLTLLPFEAAFYRQHAVPVAFVGHPLADEFPLQPDIAAARQELECADKQRIIAVLPGSRGGEINLLAPVFFEAMARLLTHEPDCFFLVPAVSEERLSRLQVLLAEAIQAAPQLAERVRLVLGQSRQVMTAADLVLMTSGTTALEAMLLKKPMVVAYKLPPLSYSILSRMVKTEHIALPNLLAGEALVPELLQQQVSAESLCQAMLQWLQQPERVAAVKQRFGEMHVQLRRDASRAAAQAVSKLLLEN